MSVNKIFVSDIVLKMSAPNCEFTNKYTLDERKAEATKIAEKYPDRIPTIIIKAPSAELPELDTFKFLVPKDLTVGQFIYVLKTKIKMTAEQALFIFVNGVIPPTASMMEAIYSKHRANDDFLYFTIATENTFG